MNVSSTTSVNQLPAAMQQATVELQQKMLAMAATQSVQAIPTETMMQVMNLLGLGGNLDTTA